ncbi:LysR family transcriptional regulator [Allohahella marinimesophila]|uniref:LysR family transcriptional regulator n=1 Tax=Allohahella marinimesophila TaxID=1054972 RepID=A0ABP7PAY5_9GAMM
MNKTNIDRFDLNLLTVFVAIYSEGSITAAANTLHLSQSAISHALNRLREQLGDELFQRSGRSMSPTPAAEQLIGPIRQSLVQIQQGIVACTQQEGLDLKGLTTRFRLCVRDSFEGLVLPELIAICSRLAPKASFASMRTPREQVLHDLRSGRIDLAADILLPHDDQIQHVELLTDDWVCVLSATHPLLEEDWELSGVLKYRHVMVSSREHGAGFEDTQLARHGLRREIALRTSNYLAAIQTVAITSFIVCAPRRLADALVAPMGGRVVVRPFPMQFPPLELYLYWHRRVEHDRAHVWLREQILKLTAGLA